MREDRRANREDFGPGPQGLGTIFADDPDAGGLATVAHGCYAEELPVGGMTVGEIRARFRDRFDIDPASHAVLDGYEVDDDTVVHTGQLLTFMRKAGEKGLCGWPRHTPAA